MGSGSTRQSRACCPPQQHLVPLPMAHACLALFQEQHYDAGGAELEQLLRSGTLSPAACVQLVSACCARISVARCSPKLLHALLHQLYYTLHQLHCAPPMQVK